MIELYPSTRDGNTVNLGSLDINVFSALAYVITSAFYTNSHIGYLLFIFFTHQTSTDKISSSFHDSKSN